MGFPDQGKRQGKSTEKATEKATWKATWKGDREREKEMTVKEAILWVYSQKSNAVPEQVKVRWLERLDGMLYRQVVQTHICPFAAPGRYSISGGGDQTLLISPPYDGIYIDFLNMKTDLEQGDIDRYNNSARVFNEALDDWKKWVNRTYMPRSEEG